MMKNDALTKGFRYNEMGRNNFYKFVLNKERLIFIKEVDVLRSMVFALSVTIVLFLSSCSNGPTTLTDEQILFVSHGSLRTIPIDEKALEPWEDYFAMMKEETADIDREENESEPPPSEQKEEPVQQPDNDFEPTEVDLTFANGTYFLGSEFFNQIETIDGKETIQNPTNILVLANKRFYLPSTYRPSDLVLPNVPFVFQNVEQNYLRKEAAVALERMFTDAKKEGITLIARSGFRSYQTQSYLFNREVEAVGYEKASMAVAQPGTSEHQTGLTMDITAYSVNQQLVESFGQTAEGKWLENNAHKYGFILRYPKGKESITGYQYEPWHFRYIGVEAATVIFENGWTLEEFFDHVQSK
ncbi:M15 family metallopeptidase [Fervidibacillus halotolerans]|uniref:M15 family metallopeptidase n=1 Tax=Fervidibacillus halotolerans TaxID=2980027 RepID=A0A9E8LYL4_9BACI|nr:M15 family metallopeptidase [Fervidibacillus halotolerans]WAA11974.1 M15 family metallopeptidase [Fervidibacillus halotolerans]